MADGSENEVRGINCLGNPDVEVRSNDGGKSGVGPIGQRLPTGILARGQEGRLSWRDLEVYGRGKSQLRNAGSRDYGR